NRFVYRRSRFPRITTGGLDFICHRAHGSFAPLALVHGTLSATKPTHVSGNGPIKAMSRLVPRTRSLHNCAANSTANFGFKRGTRIVELLVSLDSEVRMRMCCG